MNVEVDFRARENVPRWLAYVTPVVTVLAALAVTGIAMVVLGIDPIAAYSTMFIQTLTTEFGRTEVLIKSIPLILTGLAVYLPLRAGLWNIGAEGQLLVGALLGTWVGLNVSVEWFIRIPLMFLAAGAGGGLWGAIPGWLRAKWNVNEIITSLLLTFVAADLQSYLLRGPMQGGVGAFPQSAPFPPAATIPKILALVPDAIPLGPAEMFLSGVNAGLLVAVSMVGLTYILVKKTSTGFEITFVGSNPDAAKQAGMSKYTVYILVFLIGGAFAGFAGISEIAGTEGRFRAKYSPGYGFTAIPIALLGRNSAVKVMIAGLFFSVLFVGGTIMELEHNVPSAFVDVIQALIIMFLITAEFFKNYRLEWSIHRETDTGGPSPAGGDN